MEPNIPGMSLLPRLAAPCGYAGYALCVRYHNATKKALNMKTLSEDSDLVRTAIVLEKGLIEAIEEWRWNNRVDSRSEAIRTLLWKALGKKEPRRAAR